MDRKNIIATTIYLIFCLVVLLTGVFTVSIKAVLFLAGVLILSACRYLNIKNLKKV